MWAFKMVTQFTNDLFGNCIDIERFLGSCSIYLLMHSKKKLRRLYKKFSSFYTYDSRRWQISFWFFFAWFHNIPINTLIALFCFIYYYLISIIVSLAKLSALLIYSIRWTPHWLLFLHSSAASKLIAPCWACKNMKSGYA